MMSYKSTIQLYYNNFSTTPTQQPDDVMVSSSPASVNVANTNDEEQCHRSRKKRLKTSEAPAIDGYKRERENW